MFSNLFLEICFSSHMNIGRRFNFNGYRFLVIGSILGNIKTQLLIICLPILLICVKYHEIGGLYDLIIYSSLGC